MNVKKNVYDKIWYTILDNTSVKRHHAPEYDIIANYCVKLSYRFHLQISTKRCLVAYCHVPVGK